MLDVLSSRLTLRPGTNEIARTERILALGRLALSAGFLAALHLDFAEPLPKPFLALGLILLYTGHSLALTVLLWRWTDVSDRFSWALQASDILWPCLICFLTNGARSPFFFYFFFASLAAAFRWGMRETLLILAVTLAAMAGETYALHHLGFRAPAGAVPKTTFMMRSLYLTIFALLTGYLAETEKRRRSEAFGISQVLSKVRVEAGMKSTLQAVMRELLKLLRGREMLLLARESGTDQVNVWRMEKLKTTGEMRFTWRRMNAAEALPYFSDLPPHCAGAAWLRGSASSVMAIDRDGRPLRQSECHLSPEILSRHRFDRLLTSSILFPPDLSCRLFIFEPKAGGTPKEQLRFLRDLTNRVAPAAHNVYLLRRLRSRAAAAERARLAQDLHDGVVQSLHALAFRLYAFRTGSMTERERTAELLAMQELAQKEASNLRSLIQHSQPVDLDPKQLVDFLAGMIERYGYDTGITAKFVCEADDVDLPAATCREIAGIVQEALANVRKHSGAENVEVRITSQTGAWVLAIEDDGRGFQFGGRFSQSELERMRRGPVIIKERASAIGGELTIESRPGQGARLEIRFAKSEAADVA